MAVFYRPPFERPPTNNMPFQHAAPNSAPAGAPMSGDLDLVIVKTALFCWLMMMCLLNE